MPPAYSVSPARYAKNMMAVRCTSDGSGFKTRAMRLASYFARDRYTGREDAYIMSKAAAAKFEQHYCDGYDAGTILRKLYPPKKES